MFPRPWRAAPLQQWLQGEWRSSARSSPAFAAVTPSHSLHRRVCGLPPHHTRGSVRGGGVAEGGSDQ